MPPLRQYFSRLREPDESIPDPKGRESWTPQPFPLQNRPFWGPREGAIVAFLDPRACDAVPQARPTMREPCSTCKPATAGTFAFTKMAIRTVSRSSSITALPRAVDSSDHTLRTQDGAEFG